jgi:integrase
MLLQGYESMKGDGTIRARDKCPVCGRNFAEVKGVAFVCLEHKTVPAKLYVDLPWKGQRIRIYSDKTGQVLDTYDRANTVLKTIRAEIENHSFDPQRYLKADASKFWTANLLEFFKQHKLKSLAPGYKAYFSYMVGLAKAYFGDQDVRDLRKLDLINYKDHLEKTFNWKPKTLKNVLDVFKAFLRYVKDDLEMITTVPSFPVVDVPDTAFKWIGQKDQASLFEHVPDQHKPLIAFLMLHGCRPGEARALKCKNVDLEHDSITIGATFSGGVYCERRKGRGARVLVIPIHPEMREYMVERVRNSHPEAFVFVNPMTGRPYSETRIWKLWNKVRTAAGVSKELRLYDASRHSFASQLVNSGVSLFTVSKLLGHSSTKMTERYSHANVESMRTELSKLSLKKKEAVSMLSPRKKEPKRDQ